MSGALDKLIEAVHAEVEDQRRYLDDIGRRLTGPVGVSRAMKDATGGLNRLLQRLEVLEHFEAASDSVVAGVAGRRSCVRSGSAAALLRRAGLLAGPCRPHSRVRATGYAQRSGPHA
jgi:hypothetical protein